MTYLDLDDVAATSPLAQAELEALRARVKELEAERNTLISVVASARERAEQDERELAHLKAVADTSGLGILCKRLVDAERERDEFRLRSGDDHPGYVIGVHWMTAAYARICAGEDEPAVMRDYGYCDERDAARYRWLVNCSDGAVWQFLSGMDDDQIDEAIDKWIDGDELEGKP